MALLTDGLPGGDFMHGMIDDFAVYSTEVSAADAAKLAKGSAPTSVTGLVAYWPFDDAVPPVSTTPKLSVSRDSSGKVVITFEGTLQSSDAIGGTWSDVSGSSPLTVTPTGAQKFYRAKLTAAIIGI
jgi:hypothetical protein